MFGSSDARQKTHRFDRRFEGAASERRSRAGRNAAPASFSRVKPRFRRKLELGRATLGGRPAGEWGGMCPSDSLGVCP